MELPNQGILKHLSNSNGQRECELAFAVQFIAGKEITTGQKRRWRMCLNDGQCVKTLAFICSTNKQYGEALKLLPFCIIEINNLTIYHAVIESKNRIFFCINSFKVIKTYMEKHLIGDNFDNLDQISTLCEDVEMKETKMTQQRAKRNLSASLGLSKGNKIQTPTEIPNEKTILTNNNKNGKNELEPNEPCSTAVEGLEPEDEPNHFSQEETMEHYDYTPPSSQNTDTICRYSIGTLGRIEDPGPFKIIGRLTKLSPVIGPTTEDKKWVHLTLEDETGKICMTIWNEQITRLVEENAQPIELGKIYEVCYPKIYNRDLSKFSEHMIPGLVPKELKANFFTKIQEKEELPEIPKFQFNFVKISEVHLMNVGKYVDVLAIVSHQSRYNLENRYPRLVLTLQDDSNLSIKVTIWRWWGLANDYSDLKGKIIALKNAEIGQFNGNKELKLSRVCGSLCIEPMMEEARELKALLF
ncbi:uncharacterized protein LOC136033204 [Artemia franciscana]|uniref:Replication protein A OB domain-containing protein n=1 Tax=Artemia franciscana TaxID=6661 RepID=A0AA88LC09_ARTSF|nr:hypothetical protein QYM36_001358 [Artemia franciscana]